MASNLARVNLRNIRYAHLCEAVFYECSELAKRGVIPTIKLNDSERIVRTVQSNLLWSNWKDTRTIPPNNSKSDSNRFSGMNFDGKGKAALYTSRTEYASWAEVAHYAIKEADRGIGWSVLDAIAKGGINPLSVYVNKISFQYRLKKKMEVANLSLNESAQAFLLELGQKASIKSALKLTPYFSLLQAMLADNDHSVSRALGYAISEYGYPGVIAQSAREVPLLEKSGPNVIFYGEDSQDMDFLQPAYQIVLYVHPETGELKWRVRDISRSEAEPPEIQMSDPSESQISALRTSEPPETKIS